MHSRGANYSLITTCQRTFVSKYMQKSIGNLRDSKEKLTVL
jgi:hypothetical protein